MTVIPNVKLNLVGVIEGATEIRQAVGSPWAAAWSRSTTSPRADQNSSRSHSTWRWRSKETNYDDQSHPRVPVGLRRCRFAAGAGSITGKVTATPEKYLKDTIVYLKEVPGKFQARTHTMDQKGIEFRPRILTVTTGDTVKFLNSDGVDHNVYSPDQEAYNLGIFAKGQSRDHVFAKPGVYSQLCSVHPEMQAYVFVGQNPHSATVKPDGSFKIDNVPPGTYQLAVWNVKLKADDVPVTVDSGKSARADFALAR